MTSHLSTNREKQHANELWSIQSRIKEFLLEEGGGGSDPNNFKSKKKIMIIIKRGGGEFTLYSAPVWLTSILAIGTDFQTNCFLRAHKNTFVVILCHSPPPPCEIVHANNSKNVSLE